ncbi:iron-containing alcohol dehydrogenase PsrA [Agrobacterium tumefaciens]|uniref:iron-containing alcohol dehydrogenase PsrA n=1 Tax=Agrobacterium tumefaciens TaxID=358 RepID=UPI0021FB07CA|nr:phosphonoacetaldehyde reductase [Agrobacterium tumefaciens]
MWSYCNPVNVHFGRGSFSELAGAIGGRSYALVTYPDAHFQALAADLATKAGKPVLVIDDIAPNPDIVLLKRQMIRFSELKDAPEVIVALGGGSVIDSAKVFAASPSDFASVEAFLKKQSGAETLTPIPLIAVPTTAGTGSEVTCWGTVWDKAAGAKFSLAHAGLYPECAIIDPDLMIGKPRELTIQTGLDALSHALESLWNRSANPVSMNHAVSAARGVLATLPLLVNDLENGDLRERLALAATLAGFAFSNTKTAIAHSLSYPITLHHGVPHGIACSFTLPAIIRSVAAEKGICEVGLGQIFGASASGAAEQMSAFLQDLGVSTDYHHYGLQDDEFRELIDAAFDGERGQNFIGQRARLQAAFGFISTPGRAVA